MKLWIKRSLVSVALLLLLSSLAVYIGITIGNDCLAKRVEKDLKAYPLPSQTTLVESVCAAGKLTGNGNGMQYMGALLITAEDILKHYQTTFAYVDLQRQTSPTIASLHRGAVRFRKTDFTDGQPYYAVICWGSQDDYVGEFIGGLLNGDLRGH